MLPRRALKVVLICIIAIWASAGIIPDQAACSAATPAQTHQVMNGPGSGPAPGRDRQATVVNPAGDPDEYCQTGGSTPVPGSGNQPPQDHGVSILILVLLFDWWLLVRR